MSRLKQSVSAWCFEKTMAPEALARTMAEIGYDAVDLAPETHWPLFRGHGLAIAAVNGHRSIEEGLNRRENHDGIEQEIIANLERAVRWGIANLIVFSGNRRGLGDAEGAEVTVEGLRRVARAAEDAGVTLVLELLNSKVDHPDYQCDRTAWGIQVCRMVESPCVKLLYDIYHMQVMEGDIIRTIRDHHQYFGHYHTGGVPGCNELGPTQELYFPAIMRAVLDTGYEGYVGQEFIPTGDPAAALREAFAACNVSA